MESRHEINFYWLLRLRWGAVIGQLFVILLAKNLKFDLPLTSVLSLVGISVAVNLWGAFWARGIQSIHPNTVPVVMAVDVMLLTGLLYFTGGPKNPFSSLYLVHIALAAVVMPPIQTWALVGQALGCLGALFFFHRPLVYPEESLGWFSEPEIKGIWVSVMVASVFIVYFVQRVTGALAQREAELARAQELTIRAERLTSLATLSAGAAHELSTPLSTIAIVAKELERLLIMKQAPPHAVHDAQLIRTEVQRCRDILEQMAAEAGNAVGEPIVETSAEQLCVLARDGLAQSNRVIIDVSSEVLDDRAYLPQKAVAQAIRSVLKNAIQASETDIQLKVSVSDQKDIVGWRVDVQDQGTGMSQDVLSRASEPFFTTKEPGAGMGLGLFLVTAVIERLGGRLMLDSKRGEGTTASIYLPTSCSQIFLGSTSTVSSE